MILQVRERCSYFRGNRSVGDIIWPMIFWGFKPLRGTRPETNILVAPETLGLVQMSFLLEAFRPPARCEVLVFGSVNLQFLQQMVFLFVDTKHIQCDVFQASLIGELSELCCECRQNSLTSHHPVDWRLEFQLSTLYTLDIQGHRN